MALKVERGVYDRQEHAGEFSPALVGILRDPYPGEWTGGWWTAIMQRRGCQRRLSSSQRRGIEGPQGRRNPEVA